MKKLLLLVSVCILSLTGKATHLMGGQITSRNLGGLTYEVTLTAYRDTLGIPMYPTTLFNFSDAAATWSQVDVVSLNGPVVFGNGVEEYTYIDTIIFPAAGSYSVWFEDCCRNCAILNIVNPCSYSFHLYNNISTDAGNSSPVFLNAPITLAQLNVPFTYNPLPFDADGDSIAWTLDVPVTSGGVPVGGYTLPPSDISSPFTMDPVTGVISFLPNAIGNYEVSVLVSEYRGGVQIGEIRRDMQIIVVASVNAPVIVSTSSNTIPVASNSYELNSGSSFSLTVAVLDPDYRNISMSASGEPFLLASNPAVLTETSNQGFISGTVNWTPNTLQERIAPYIMSLRVAEPYDYYTFDNDITFELRVHSPTGIANIEGKSQVGIYPNPNDGNFRVEISSASAGKADVVITNMIGQEIKNLKNIQLNEGSNVILFNVSSLPKGQYRVSVLKDGKVSSVNNFEVTY
jgi:hypothetical protein